MASKESATPWNPSMSKEPTTPLNPSATSDQDFEPLDGRVDVEYLARGAAADIWKLTRPVPLWPFSFTGNHQRKVFPVGTLSRKLVPSWPFGFMVNHQRVLQKVLRVGPLSRELVVSGTEVQLHRDLWKNFLKDYRTRVKQWEVLHHKNLVQVMGFGDGLNLQVEFCEQGSVREYLESEPRSYQQKFRIIFHVLSGLDYMHTLDPPVVHGNLNAGKLFIDASGTTKIGEFGLAALCHPFAAFVPSVSPLGLSRWLGPEVLDMGTEGSPLPTTASDMWALGCTLYEIVVENIPYSNCKYDMQVRRSIRRGNRPGERGRQFWKYPFDHIWPWLTDCWEINPDERPSAFDILIRVTYIFPHSRGPIERRGTQPLELAHSHFTFLFPPDPFAPLETKRTSFTTESQSTAHLKERKWIEKVVIFALILDLIAFTIPLSLSSPLLDWYIEEWDGRGWLSAILQMISKPGYKFAPYTLQHKWNVVLLRVLMGSLFSFLQSFISPYIGSLSDKYGRKRILLASMLGKIALAVVWIQSTSFTSFLLALGGISGVNVQVSITIISDITTHLHRPSVLMLIEVVSSAYFTIGPSISAYFSTNPSPPSSTSAGFNIYATPATLALFLLLAETVFLAAYLPETKGSTLALGGDGGSRDEYEDLSLGDRRSQLKQLGNLHFIFLGLFSWAEFALTFLTYNFLDRNDTQNSYIFGLVGAFAALLGGGYVRHTSSIVHEGKISCLVVVAITIMVAQTLLHGQARATKQHPRVTVNMLHAAAALLSFASARVITSLTMLVPLQCDKESSLSENNYLSATKSTHGSNPESHAQVNKSMSRRSFDSQFPGDKITSTVEAGIETPGHGGWATNDKVNSKASAAIITIGRGLGDFRSSGQLGRAIGPLLACFACYTMGPFTVELVMLALSYIVTFWDPFMAPRTLFPGFGNSQLKMSRGRPR